MESEHWAAEWELWARLLAYFLQLLLVRTLAGLLAVSIRSRAGPLGDHQKTAYTSLHSFRIENAVS
jgi:hypothetical protein